MGDFSNFTFDFGGAPESEGFASDTDTSLNLKPEFKYVDGKVIDPQYIESGGSTDWGFTKPEFGNLTPEQEAALNESLGIFGGGVTAKDLPSILEGGGVLDNIKRVADTLGLTNKDGSYDWKKIIGLGAAGITAYDTLNRKQVPVKTVSELVGQLPSNTPPGFTPGALTAMQVPLKAGNQLQRQSAADMPSALVPGVRTYADGGEVEGPLSQGYVTGDGGGQDDLVEARLSPGEYVFDAESVSMLGDGDNAAGARKLDELRAAMRAHKRSASPDEIAPRSLGPLSYMKGGLNG